ncbi:PREDICTED: UPF0764 protein C16orf89 homolog [Miniopterus natalensis]|uniref:UPF0764 protein C16orf89 homolog n=1 Tax=Miniopterus natalensis TaxID=291302 RepID=UPI0007A6C7E9|nr:PREDICTED: UPF0764 protein C16orf89 homolog [Miniopterus natalensis]
MSSLGLLLLLLLLPPPLLPSSLPPLDTPEGKATITGLILSSLERATSFLEKRLPEINLDGVVGFRVLEVQLKGVEEEWARDPWLQPQSLHVGRLVRRLEPLLRRSISYLELSDPQYLREFQPTVQHGFWKLPHAWTHTNTSMVYPTVETQDSFSEEHSDLCLVQLLGTGNDSSPPCSLSDLCRTLMTRPGCLGYGLSHQLLFFLSARAVNAEDEAASKVIQHQQHYLKRVKRREKLFADGCSSHNTAMAVGALGGFLYALAQYPPANRALWQATPAPPSATDTDGSVSAAPGR